MKLRSGNLLCLKGSKMDITEENAIETDKGVSSSIENVSSEMTSSSYFSKETRPVDTMIESFVGQLNILKEHINNKFDSINKQLSTKIDEKVDELKVDFMNKFENFQKEIKLNLELKQKDITDKMFEIGLDKSTDNPITVTVEPDDTGISSQNDHVVIDLEPSAIIGQNTHSCVPNNNIVQMSEPSHSVMAKVTAQEIVTPLKNLSLPSITDSPDYLRTTSAGPCVTTSSSSMMVPCTVLSGNVLQNIPVLAVAPAHTTLTICSPTVQTPVTKPLRTLKPKLTTEEFIGSDFDIDAEDYVRPMRLYTTISERLSLPGNPRVRTRGGLRRGELRVTSGDSKEVSNKSMPPERGESNRGARRGRKSKPFPVIRRQSERLKKIEPNDSPMKTNFQDSIGNIEEFIWGRNSEKSAEPTPEKTTGEEDQGATSENRKENKTNTPSVLDSLLQIDSICDNIQSHEIINKNKTVLPDDNENSTEIIERVSKSETIKGISKVNVAECSSGEKKDKHKEEPKDTPRNLPVPVKKGLSLSSPRKGSYIRSLEFSTPVKKPSPRKAHTSPKAVSQVKLAQMRSLRRTNLFKSPLKKIKQSWDADLRAFVAPDIPLSSVNMKKRLPPKRPGRSGKFLSPKKKMLLKKNKNKKINKRPLKTKKETSEETSKTPEKTVDLPAAPETPSKTTEELVKQIEKDVLEVIAEENSISENSDNSSSIDLGNVTNCDNGDLEKRKSGNEVLSIQSKDNYKEIEEPIVVQISGKGLNKTPAKLDFAGLIAANMMTPVTKILKEQSSLLDNVHFLTPGFLPTPDGATNRDLDVRKVGTPSPKFLPPNDTNKTDSDSNQSPTTIKECPVRIEDALAAEELVVKPLQKESVVKTPTSKSRDETPKTKASLSLTTIKSSEKKSNKTKSFEKSLIDVCLRNVEKDLFGQKNYKKSPKKNKSVSESIIKSKKEKPIKSIIKGKKIKATDPQSVSRKSKEHIKVPSFEEMMSRLNKMNKISSSSSDSSDTEIEKRKIDDCHNSLSNDSFPRLRVSEDDSVNSVFEVKRLKNQTQLDAVTKSVKTCDLALPAKNLTSKDTFIENKKHFKKNNEVTQLVSSSVPSIKEEIKDFSYHHWSNTALKEYSFNYFDEGKNGERTIEASPTLHLFEFPFERGKQNYNCDPKLSVSSTKSSDFTSKKTEKNYPKYDKMEKISHNSPHSVKQGKSTVGLETARSFKHSSKTENRERMRLLRSKSREPRHSLKYSRVGLSSHRMRYYERCGTPLETRRDRYVDLNYKRIKRERAEEYRRKGGSSLNKGHGDRHSRSSERRVHSSTHSRSDSKKERERIHSPEHKGSKSKRQNLNEEQLENTDETDRKSKESPSKKYSNSDVKHDKRNRSEEKICKSSSNSHKKDERSRGFYHHPSDPRVYLKNRDTQNHPNAKPLAESTPNDKKKVLRESLSINTQRSFQKSRHVDSPDLESSQTFQNDTGSHNVQSDFRGSSLKLIKNTEERSNKDNENIRREYPSHLGQSASYSRTSTSVQLNIVESPSSPVDQSSESPLRDPRLASKLYSNINRQEQPDKIVKPTKRKIKELEEGEISDDSSFSEESKHLYLINKKRKLSVIPEGL